MVENLGLVGEESFAAIGANGKWQRLRLVCLSAGVNPRADGEEVQATGRDFVGFEGSTGFGPRLKTEPGWARLMNSLDRWTFSRSSRW